MSINVAWIEEQAVNANALKMGELFIKVVNL